MILAIAGLFYGFILFFLFHVIVPRYPFYEVFFHRLQKHTHMSVLNTQVPGLVAKYQE